MHPTEVLGTYAGAQFVARARLAEDQTEVWGILLRVPAPEGDPGDRERKVVTDDGRSFAARAVTPMGAAADPAATLAAARYWELPPSYVNVLRQAANSEETGTGDG